MLEHLIPIANELERSVFSTFGSSGEVARLRRMNNKTSNHLADAFSSSIERQASDAEKLFISQIEDLRREMEESVRDVEIVDFGAGSGSNREPGRIVHAGLGAICRGTSRRPASGLLLMKLLRAFQPETAIELGTSVGISAAYQAAAMQLNQRGRLITLEGAPAVASIAASNLAKLGLSERAEVVVGRFVDTLPGVLDRIGPIDFAFIDGHHDFAATLEYFDSIKPSLSDSAVVMFDDIAWSSGMAAAWKKIVADPQVGLVVNIFSMGLCVLNGPKQSFRIALPRS
jgi:predicted O-methyltransferase YrrM